MSELIIGRRLRELPFPNSPVGAEVYGEKFGESVRLKVGDPGGLNTLDEDGKIPADQIPADMASLRQDLAVPSSGGTLVGFQQVGAGAVTRTVLDKLREHVSVKDFGAVGDGVADDTAAIQAAINATVDASNPTELVFPKGAYKITADLTWTGYLLARCDGLASAEIITTAAIDVFKGAAGFFRGLKVTHNGASGSCFVLTGDGAGIDDCVVSSASSGIAVMLHASNQAVRDCMFSVSNGFCIGIVCDSTINPLCINGRITGNTFYGVGQGIIHKANPSSGRPEGWNISGNKIVTTGGYQIYIEGALSLTIADNVLDQASGYSIRFQQRGAGIDGVFISGNYIAAAASPTTSLAISCDTDASGVRGVTIANNFIGYSGKGIDLNDKASEISVSGNYFSNIATTSMNISASKGVSISGNTFTGSNTHMSLADGAAGGPISLIGNVFPSTGTITVTPTDRSKFKISGNAGYTPPVAPITLINSWVNNGSGYEDAGFWKDAFGTVHLTGVIKSGAIPSVAFQLPTGFRPVGTIAFPVVSFGAFGAVEIASNGSVTVANGNTSSVSLGGISFVAEN